MVENGFSHRTGFLWGVLFPWVAALPLLYQPNALNQFINFSSLVFVSFTDFIVPCELPAAFFVVALRTPRSASGARCCYLTVLIYLHSLTLRGPLSGPGYCAGR